MMHSMRWFAATLALAGVAATGCDSVTTTRDTGTLTVFLTDAPFSTDDVESASIFIRTIQCRQTVASENQATDESSTGWTTVVSPNQAINLLVLDNGVTMNLGTATLPAGAWSSCRIVIDPAQSTVTLVGGEPVDVKWPSAGQSGIKVQLASPIVVEDSSTIVVDFDVGSSFVLRGNDIRNNGLLFKPVVHAVAMDVSATFSGRVVGDSTNGAPISGAVVQILPAGTTLADDTTAALWTTTSATDGTFTFNWLLPGTYAVRASAPSGSAYKAALLSGGLSLVAQEDRTGAVLVLTK